VVVRKPNMRAHDWRHGDKPLIITSVLEPPEAILTLPQPQWLRPQWLWLVRIVRLTGTMSISVGCWSAESFDLLHRPTTAIHRHKGAPNERYLSAHEQRCIWGVGVRELLKENRFALSGGGRA